MKDTLLLDMYSVTKHYLNMRAKVLSYNCRENSAFAVYGSLVQKVAECRF